MPSQAGEWSVADFEPAQAAGQWTVEDLAPRKRASTRRPIPPLSPEDEATFQAGIQPPEPSSLLEAAGSSALEGLSAVPGAVGVLGSKIPGPVGDVVGGAGRAAFEHFQGGARALDPLENRGQGGLPEDLARGLGSIAGAVPAMALGPGAAAVQFGAQSGVPLYYDVRESTGDEEAALWALIGGGALGQLEKFGVEGLLSGAVKRWAGGPVGKEIVKKLTQRALGIGAAGVGEAGTELAQQAGEDLLFENLTGEDVANIELLKRALPPALILGTGLGALVESVDAYKARKGTQAAPGATQAPGEAQWTTTDVAPPAEAPGRTVGDISLETAPGAQVESAPVAGALAQPSAIASEGLSGGDAVRVGVPGELVTGSGDTPAPLSEEEMTPEQFAADLAPTPEGVLQPERQGSSAVEQPPAGRPSADAVGGSTPPPDVSPSTGIKNASVERELKEMGLPLPEKAERRTFVDLHAEAKATIEKTPDAGRALVDDLEAKIRPPTDAEDALLTFEANRLVTERDKTEEAFLADPSEENQARIDRAKADYARAAGVFDRAGTESGRSLNARKLMLAHDYSLAAMERSVSIAKGGEPLTAAETAKVKELQKKIEETTKAHEEYVTAAELKRANLEAENALLRLQREAKGSVRKAKRTAAIDQAKKDLDDALNELGASMTAGALGGGVNVKALAKAASAVIRIGGKTFAQFADDMVARFGEAIRPHLQLAWDTAEGERRKSMAASLKGKETPEEMHRGVQKIALDFVEAGITDRDALVKAVHGVVKEADPDMSLESTRDAISGYGIFRKLSAGEAKKKLRDLKGQMQQVAKLEALEEKVAIKKTGFERQEPSPTQKRLAKQVRDLQRKLGLTAKPDRLKALKTRLQNRIDDLEARLEAKDFSDKPKPAPVELDEEAVKLKAKESASKRLFEREKERHRMANRTRAQKILDAGKEVWRFPRAVLSAFDVSAPFRQGVFFTLGHPVRSMRHMRQMFRALRSESAAAEIDAEIEKRSEFARASGLDLAPIEEEMVSQWAGKVPGVRPSNRAFTTFMNLQRLDAFDALVAALPTTPTSAQGKALASAVNMLTGRGVPSKKYAGAMELLSAVLWSPRLLLSRFQTLLGVPAWRGDLHTRKLVVKEYARFLAGVGAVYALVQTLDALDDEDDITVTMDPRSSDFGKIKVGSVRFDPLGGLAQITTFLGRSLSGETKKTTTGEVVALKGPDRPFKGDSWGDVAKNFLRYKLSPVASQVWDVLEGETTDWEPVSPATVGEGLLVPISFRDLKEGIEKHGLPEAAAMTLISMFGVGVQDYSKEKKK